MKGWYGDRQQHSLASKGIKTNIFDKAKTHFGVTDIPYEAGYIIPDGSMLRFVDESLNYTGHTRTREHDEVDQIDIGMPEFMMLGAIRFHMGKGLNEINLEFATLPTTNQKRIISNLLKDYKPDTIIVDTLFEENKENMEYKTVSKRFNLINSPNKIFLYIEEEFNE